MNSLRVCGLWFRACILCLNFIRTLQKYINSLDTGNFWKFFRKYPNNFTITGFETQHSPLAMQCSSQLLVQKGKWNSKGNQLKRKRKTSSTKQRTDVVALQWSSHTNSTCPYISQVCGMRWERFVPTYKACEFVKQWN